MNEVEDRGLAEQDLAANQEAQVTAQNILDDATKELEAFTRMFDLKFETFYFFICFVNMIFIFFQILTNIIVYAFCCE